jgi:hypothetical protein
MRDPNEEPRRRDEMAWRAAPYCHARKVGADVKVNEGLGERLERALQRVREAEAVDTTRSLTPSRPREATENTNGAEGSRGELGPVNDARVREPEGTSRLRRAA